MARPLISEQPAAKEKNTEYRLDKLVVAHDASEGSTRALDDAIFLAERFRSEVLVVHIQQMTEDTVRQENMDNHVDLEAVGNRLTALGIRNQGILRAGGVGDMLFNLCCEEDAGLLMLGAYGYGPQDRSTLGSTAEYLLRALPCPAVTYGPNVTSSLSSIGENRPILVPISLPCNHTQLKQAAAIANLFGTRMELLHTEDFAGMPVTPKATEELEQQCEQLTSMLCQEGMQTEWSLLFGKPADAIRVRSRYLNSPLIVMPLHWGRRLSSITSDNVAAHVIRSSTLPVMTCRTE